MRPSTRTPTGPTATRGREAVRLYARSTPSSASAAGCSRDEPVLGPPDPPMGTGDSPRQPGTTPPTDPRLPAAPPSWSPAPQAPAARPGRSRCVGCMSRNPGTPTIAGWRCCLVPRGPTRCTVLVWEATRRVFCRPFNSGHARLFAHLGCKHGVVAGGRCRRLPSSEAGCRRPSMSRTQPVGEPTASLPEISTRSRRSPAGDRATVHPASVSGPATTALSAPIARQSTAQPD